MPDLRELVRAEAQPKRHTVAEIQAKHGSFRRMVAAYWTGLLSPEDESVLEEKFPHETLLGYKPVTQCDYLRQ